MSEQRCDRCRYWKEDAQSGWEYRFSDFRLCTAVKMRSKVLDAATDGLGLGWADGEEDWDEYGDKPPPPNSWTGVRMAALKEARAVVQDGSDYMAELLTAPDFFCALFAEKEPEQ
jgi:hypothetical protein